MVTFTGERSCYYVCILLIISAPKFSSVGFLSLFIQLFNLPLLSHFCVFRCIIPFRWNLQIVKSQTVGGNQLSHVMSVSLSWEASWGRENCSSKCALWLARLQKCELHSPASYIFGVACEEASRNGFPWSSVGDLLCVMTQWPLALVYLLP